MNPHVRVRVATPLELTAAISDNKLGVVCQTELLVNGEFGDPELTDKMCRKFKCKYIFAQSLGVCGTVFQDFDDHVINDPDGVNTR